MIPDVATFVEIDRAYGIGDQREQVEAALDGCRRRGQLPVDGWDLDLEWATFSVVDTEAKRAAADALADAGVVAVVGGRDFTYGAVRLAETHHCPVIDVNAVPTALLDRTAPWMFTLRAAQDVLYRAFARWAVRSGHLGGRTVGVFSDRFTGASTEAALGELRSAGVEPAVVVASDGAGVGSADDQAMAQQCLESGVDAVLAFVSGSSLRGLLSACDQLGYRPAVVDLETGEHTTDVTAALLPEWYDGTWALTMSRVGDAPAGNPPAATTAEALDDFERGTGRRLEPGDAATSGELTNVLLARDLVHLLLEGLGRAPEPTREGIVRGLEAINGLPMASGGDVAFGPSSHGGIRQVREVQWDHRARAWVARSGFMDMAGLLAPAPPS